MASNFKSKEYDPYEELMLAVKLEDYERAAELRDLINADHERQRQ
jgi:protein-arginine kinase activator protein McsA